MMIGIMRNRGNVIITVVAIIAGIFIGLIIHSSRFDAEAVIGGIGNLGTDPNNKHNLSNTGLGNIVAVSETQICIFCHTPHSATTDATLINGPLWNHRLSSATYGFTNQKSFVINATTMPSRAVDGASKMCMSCHDGTVGIGRVYSRTTRIEMKTTGTCLDTNEQSMTNACSGFLGTNPSHHIYSVPMNDQLIAESIANCTLTEKFRIKYPWQTVGDALANPDVLLRPTKQKFRDLPGIARGKDESPVGRYKTGYNYGVQCSSCHDPHLYFENGGVSCKFLVSSGCNSAPDKICNACHTLTCP
ncbi:MAG: hypothetical protein HY805_09385 [Nitrospirae bacterium]|nr:hypothetical protein [Nitrospirota bacterium]